MRWVSIEFGLDIHLETRVCALTSLPCSLAAYQTRLYRKGAENGISV